MTTTTISRIPREEEVEGIFSKILQSPDACARLKETFYAQLDEDHLTTDSSPEHFSKVLFSAYETQDISALLLEVCQKSMFDLLRDAYLIPKRFHGKAGENPVLLTDPDGNLLEEAEKTVSHREISKFQAVYKNHPCVPRSKIYLADGYDIVRSYTDDLKIRETFSNQRRGVLILYALPDTAELGMTESQAYAVVWEAFCEIQRAAATAMVYYGQDTGLKNNRRFDEIGVLLPLRQFESRMLHHLQEIDGIVLGFREKMFKMAGRDSLEF